jgi:hypothetical protein
MILQLQYDAFPPLQAALVAEEFRLGAKHWLARVLQTRVAEPIEFAEGVVTSRFGMSPVLPERDAPWPENHFRFSLHAFTAEQVVVLLLLRVSYDRTSGSFTTLKDEVLDSACILDRYSFPGDDWLEWFARGPRCPACAIMPDMTSEYLPCELCEYADYRHDSPDTVRDSFFGDPKRRALADSVRIMLRGAVDEPDRTRRLYLRYRLANLERYLDPSTRTGLRSLPWEEG